MTYLGGDTVSGIAVAPDTTVFISDGSDNAITGYLARFDADLTQRLAYLSYYPGSDQTVGPRQRVYLDGSDSSDSDGQIVQYHWTQVAGKTVSKKSADSVVANFVTPRVKRGAAITLGFELEVTDDLGATAVDQVNINVMR